MNPYILSLCEPSNWALLSLSVLICECHLFYVQDCTIRSCDFDTEQTCVLHSPEKRTEQITIDTEVHLALTPLQPVVFFGFHKKMSVTGLAYSSFFYNFFCFPEMSWRCSVTFKWGQKAGSTVCVRVDL